MPSHSAECSDIKMHRTVHASKGKVLYRHAGGNAARTGRVSMMTLRQG